MVVVEVGVPVNSEVEGATVVVRDAGVLLVRASVIKGDVVEAALGVSVVMGDVVEAVMGVAKVTGDGLVVLRPKI